MDCPYSSDNNNHINGEKGPPNNNYIIHKHHDGGFIIDSNNKKCCKPSTFLKSIYYRPKPKWDPSYPAFPINLLVPEEFEYIRYKRPEKAPEVTPIPRPTTRQQMTDKLIPPETTPPPLLPRRQQVIDELIPLKTPAPTTAPPTTIP